MKSNIFGRIIRQNKDFIKQRENENISFPFLKKVTTLINKNKIIVISGVDFGGKTSMVKEIIEKTKIHNSYLYLNTRLDFFGHISSEKSLLDCINYAKKQNSELKYIFLQNIGLIEDIKSALSQLMKSNYKIILIGNDVQIPGIAHISLKKEIGDDIDNNLLYGNLAKVAEISSIAEKKEYIHLLRNTILLENIFQLKSVANISLYTAVLSYLAEEDEYKSIREYYRDFSQVQDISLKTFMDYLEYSDQSKIVEKVYKYDLKLDKAITTSSQYYFLDNGIRNSLSHFSLSKYKLIKNLLFLHFYSLDFEIYGGRNGQFQFSFFLKKGATHYSVHLSETTNKASFKKEIHKLNKIDTHSKKFLLLQDADTFSLKKYRYENVEIMFWKDFLEKIEL